MVKLQEFIEQNYNKQGTTKIDISQQLASVDELKEVEGGKLDLSDYSNLELLRINGSYLKTSLTELILRNNPKLTLLVIVKNMQLSKLNLTGCPNLENGKINEFENNDWFSVKIAIDTVMPGEVEQQVEVPPKRNCDII